MSTRAKRQASAQRRLAEIRRQQSAKQHKMRLMIAIPAAAMLVAASVLAIVLSAAGGPAGTPTVANHGPLAGLTSMATGAPVDAIQCATSEQSAYHIHVHLAVFVAGTRHVIPAQIGIARTCLYWLHTHDASGVVHIESPVTRTYTLGDFFDIWGQPLTASQAGPAKGTLTAYVNGSRYVSNPRSIPLRPHTVIQLDIGTNVPPQPYTFAPGL